MSNEKKILNLRPIVIFALSVVFGVVFSFAFRWIGAVSILIPSGFFVALTLALFFFFGKVERKLLLIVVSAVLFAASSIGFFIALNRYENAATGGGYYSVDGRIKSVISTDYGQKLVVTDLEFSEKGTGYDMSVYVYGSRGVDVGDRIRFFGLIEDDPLFYEGAFSAEKIDAKIRYSAVVDGTEITVYGNSKTPFESVNVVVRETLKEGLSGREFAVAYAMLTGNDGFLDADSLDSYRNAGVAHVFAVSGLHIGFVALILTFILKKLKVNGIIAATVTVLLLTAYSGVCGFTASSLRATVMCAVLLFSKLGGCRYDGLSAIALAGTLILLFSPMQLFCAGFRLSFCVVVFITLFTRPIARKLKFLPNRIATSIGAVTSAFFAGIPVSVAAFGKFSLVAVPFNLIFIPVTAVVFTALFICCVLSFVFPIAPIVFFPLRYVLLALNAVINFFDYKSFLISGLVIGGFSVFYYVCFFFLSGLVNLKRVLSFALSAVCVCVFIAGTVAFSVVEYGSAKGYVSGSDGVSLAVISRSGNAVMIVADANAGFSLSPLRRLKEKYGINSLEGVFVLDEDADIQMLTTRIMTVFTVAKIFVFGEEDQSVMIPIERSFPNTKVFFPELNGISFGGFTVGYGADGKFVAADFGGSKFAFFRRFGDGAVATEFTERYRGAVVFDHADYIVEQTYAEEVYSYRRNEKFKDGESEGILKVYFD